MNQAAHSTRRTRLGDTSPRTLRTRTHPPVCEPLEQRVVLSTVVWDGGAGSTDWNTPANWDGDVLPTFTDDVQIPAIGNDAVTLSDDAEAGTLTSDLQLVIQGGFTLQIGTSAEMHANLSIVGGTLRGGTLDFTGTAQISFTDNPGTLADVEVLDEIDPGWGRVRLEGDTRFPTLRMTVHNAQVLLAPGYTLRDHIVIEGEGSRQMWLAEGGSGEATIAPGASITLAPGSTSGLRIDQSNNASLLNQGLMAIEGTGTLDIGPLAGCTNEGTLRVTDGTLELRNINGFSSPGSFEIHGGTLQLASQLTTEGLGLERWTRSGGTVHLTSEIDNHDRTLTLNAQTGSWQMRGGSVFGGTLAFQDGARLDYTGYGGRLRDVEVQSDIVLDALNDQVTLLGTTRFGTLSLLGGNAMVHIGIGYVLYDHIVADGAEAGTRKVELGGAATFAPGSSVTLAPGCAGDLEITRDQTATLLNEGVISAGSATGELRITANIAALTNTGTIQVTAGSLRIYPLEWENQGQVLVTDADVFLGRVMTNTGQITLDNCQTELAVTTTTAGLGLPSWTRIGGTFTFSGSIDNTGDTLTLNAATGTWLLAEGDFTGGTITFADGAAFEYTADGVWFTGVQLLGEILLDGPGDWAFVYQDTRFEVARLRADAVSLRLGPSYTLHDAVIAEGAAPGTRQVWVAYAGSGDVVFGPDASVTLAEGCAGGLEVRRSRTSTLVNQGLISARAAGQTLSMTGAFPFTNAGTIEVRGSAMNLAPDQLMNVADGMLTGGTWIIDSGILSTIGGDINVSDADVHLIGTGQWPQFATIAANLGTLRLTGGVELVTQGSFSNQGMLVLDPGGMLGVVGDFSQAQTGSLVVRANGPSAGVGYGKVGATGSAALAGSLTLEYTDGFVPTEGTFFDFLTSATARTGEFDDVVLPTAPVGDKSELLYTEQGVRLLSTDLADLDLNGVTNTQDFIFFLNLWASNDPDGDVDGNGIIDTRDFIFFLNLWADG